MPRKIILNNQKKLSHRVNEEKLDDYCTTSVNTKYIQVIVLMRVNPKRYEEHLPSLLLWQWIHTAGEEIGAWGCQAQDKRGTRAFWKTSPCPSCRICLVNWRKKQFFSFENTYAFEYTYHIFMKNKRYPSQKPSLFCPFISWLCSTSSFLVDSLQLRTYLFHWHYLPSQVLQLMHPISTFFKTIRRIAALQTTPSAMSIYCRHLKAIGPLQRFNTLSHL